VQPSSVGDALHPHGAAHFFAALFRWRAAHADTRY
jgi:hypothetical protein